jgi:alkanesulfonate monooxygenase SsuD/methylene tetrahydromethanopterin reductase-like flavin-dependent oxidoreductase (luciferase family)
MSSEIHGKTVPLYRYAERGKFDFLFLAEGLRLREQNGLIYDLDVVGRPDTFTILAALAAVTGHIGLTGTINSTFNEPYEVARQFASLDHLSGGRSAWNVVTSWDAFTGENFRRGAFLAQQDRYERARTFLAAALELWDSWRGDEILADKDTGPRGHRRDRGAGPGRGRVPGTPSAALAPGARQRGPRAASARRRGGGAGRPGARAGRRPPGVGVRVDVPRPRDRDHPDLIDLRHELLRQLGITKEGQ